MNNFSMGLTLLAAADKAAAPQIEADVIGSRLLMLAALCVLPYIVGAILARALRLKEYSNRIGTVLLAFTLGLAPFGYQIAQTGKFDDWKTALRWGIDLAGGTNLIYQVQTQKALDEGKPVSEAMDKMIGTIQKRINPSGTEEVTVRRVGQDRIEVIIPGADQAEIGRAHV